MGLIKTGLKTAVAVKTADVVHNRIERRQQAEWASQAVPAWSGPGRCGGGAPDVRAVGCTRGRRPCGRGGRHQRHP